MGEPTTVMPRLSREEAADYVAQLGGELATIARNADLPLVAYLLEMARLESLRALPPLVRRSRSRPAHSG